jgi:hypothetical protein
MPRLAVATKPAATARISSARWQRRKQTRSGLAGTRGNLSRNFSGQTGNSNKLNELRQNPTSGEAPDAVNRVKTIMVNEPLRAPSRIARCA